MGTPSSPELEPAPDGSSIVYDELALRLAKQLTAVRGDASTGSSEWPLVLSVTDLVDVFARPDATRAFFDGSLSAIVRPRGGGSSITITLEQKNGATVQSTRDAASVNRQSTAFLEAVRDVLQRSGYRVPAGDVASDPFALESWASHVAAAQVRVLRIAVRAGVWADRLQTVDQRIDALLTRSGAEPGLDTLLERAAVTWRRYNDSFGDPRLQAELEQLLGTLLPALGARRTAEYQLLLGAERVYRPQLGYAEATADLVNATRLDQRLADACFLRGHRLVRDLEFSSAPPDPERVRLAVHELESAVARNPVHLRARAYLATALAIGREWQRAFQMLDDARRIAPSRYIESNRAEIALALVKSYDRGSAAWNRGNQELPTRGSLAASRLDERFVAQVGLARALLEQNFRDAERELVLGNAALSDAQKTRLLDASLLDLESLSQDLEGLSPSTDRVAFARRLALTLISQRVDEIAGLESARSLMNLYPRVSGTQSERNNAFEALAAAAVIWNRYQHDDEARDAAARALEWVMPLVSTGQPSIDRSASLHAQGHR